MASMFFFVKNSIGEFKTFTENWDSKHHLLVEHETMYESSGIKHFSLNLVIIRLTKIMNRADKNWAKL